MEPASSSQSPCVRGLSNMRKFLNCKGSILKNIGNNNVNFLKINTIVFIFIFLHFLQALEAVSKLTQVRNMQFLFRSFLSSF